VHTYSGIIFDVSETAKHPFPTQGDQSLARGRGEPDRPIARLADPSTQLGFQGDMLAALEQSVEETGLTATQKLYLKRFAKYGYKGKACASAGITAQMPSLWRRHEEYGQEFSAAEAMIQEALVEQLEESVDARAFLGYLEPVFGQLGKPEIEEREITKEDGGTTTVVKEVVQRFTGIVGYKRMFDSQLAQFRLKALAPDRYAERRKTELTGAGGGPVQVAPVVDRLSSQLARLNAPKEDDQQS
jgi:hypothetical protein